MSTVRKLRNKQPERVAINTASVDEIGRLYGIGSKLAERIIEFRSESGLLRSPDDLAKVEGIGIHLALSLAPQIDWGATDEVDHREASPWALVVITLCLLASARWVWTRVDVLRWAVSSNQWTLAWINVSILFTCFATAWAMFCLGFSELTTSSRRYRGWIGTVVRWFRNALLGLVSVGLGNTVYYSTIGWNNLLQSPRILSAAIDCIIWAVLIGSVVLVWIWPNLAKGRILPAVTNAGWLLLSPALAAYTWFFRSDLPLPTLLLGVVFSAFSLAVGIGVLQGESPFQSMVEGVLLPRDADRSSLWVEWINIRLPDPEQQKSLLAALRQVHPQSRWATLGGAVIVGAGMWLLAATAGAVWEWVVQNWLSAAFGNG